MGAVTVEAGLATVLGNLTGLHVSEEWPDTINTDAAIVNGPLTYEDEDLAGCNVNQLYEITLLFSLGGGMSQAHDRLMPYLAKSGAKSIRAALYAAPTLGGNVQAFLWRGLQGGPGRIQLAGRGFEAEVTIAEFYGATIALEVVS